MNSNVSLDKEMLTVRVGGDLLSTNAGALRHEIDGWLKTSEGTPPQWNIFRLDLSAAKMVDSVGLNLIVTLFKYAQKRGAKMQVAYTDPNVLRTIIFTRLDKHLELVKV
ncbi:MAG TPA: STAS domain-containing protein [Candidatus Acidoferrales bacterium]|nr:STAS domain-containing protein [Candidatus Acidoferrales bacterium]